MSRGTNECTDVQFSYREWQVTGSALSWRIVLSRCDVISIMLWKSFTVEVVLKVISVGTPAIRHIHVNIVTNFYCSTEWRSICQLLSHYSVEYKRMWIRSCGFCVESKHYPTMNVVNSELKLRIHIAHTRQTVSCGYVRINLKLKFSWYNMGENGILHSTSSPCLMWDNVSQECNMNWNNVRWRNNKHMSCWVWPLTICELVAKWKWIWVYGYWNLSVLKWNSIVQGSDSWGRPVFVRCAVAISRPQCVQIGAESPCNKCLYVTQM